MDLANTPTKIACGWRVYDDLPRLRRLNGSVVTVDLLDGSTTVEGRKLSPPLGALEEASRWLRERLDRDGVPPGIVTAARLTLRPEQDERGAMAITCATVLETASHTYESSDVSRWSASD